MKQSQKSASETAPWEYLWTSCSKTGFPSYMEVHCRSCRILGELRRVESKDSGEQRFWLEVIQRLCRPQLPETLDRASGVVRQGWFGIHQSSRQRDTSNGPPSDSRGKAQK